MRDTWFPFLSLIFLFLLCILWSVVAFLALERNDILSQQVSVEHSILAEIQKVNNNFEYAVEN